MLLECEGCVERCCGGERDVKAVLNGVAGVNASRWCSRAVTAHGEGFLQTPAYPQYYVGELRCQWSVRAPPGQRLLLRLLDVSLREASSSSGNCTDRLIITEDGRERERMCGEQEDVIEVVSEGDSLDVTILIGSKTLFPKRGVLLHYKALDCVHPTPPKDGYIVYRNDTYGEYMCCLDFAFPDTLNRHRVLQCVNNNTWNNTLPNCIQHSGIMDGNYNVIGPMRLNSDVNNTVYASVLNHSDLMFDVLLPTIIICVLLVGNGVILFVIYYLRKRRLSRNVEEEAGAICQPHDATERAISV
ncbi:hypothetical protein R5R35_003554 [Gryllus longicercus]|uniref:CUB domain-containing protein n=1 Tax=Gryllus longicercus TaxID=2509291 RepID=A0AAN9YWG7_9ORTH